MALGYKVSYIVSPVSFVVVSCAFGLCRKSTGAVIAQAEAIKTQSDPLLIGPQINVCLGDKLDSFLSFS